VAPTAYLTEYECSSQMIPPVRNILSTSWDPEIRRASKTGAGTIRRQGGRVASSGDGETVIGTMVEERGDDAAALIGGGGEGDGGGDGGGGDGGGGDGGG
jgi:hypothetical protein